MLKRLQNAITMSQTNSTKKKIVGEDHGYKSGISTGGNRATTGLSEARSSLSPAIAPQNGKMKNAKQMVPSERKQKNRNNNSSERRMKKRKRSFGSNDEYHSISE